MEVKTFRARSMQEALQLVRRTLGPDATLLQAREVRSGLFGWLPGARQVEVLASADVQAPCRLPASAARSGAWGVSSSAATAASAGRSGGLPALTPWDGDYRARFRAAVLADQDEPHSLVEELSRRSPRAEIRHLPEAAFRLYTDLVDAEVQEDLARELIERACQAADPRDMNDSLMLRARVARLLEDEIRVSGPLVVRPGGTRVVALVGPTGVGKTTTIAKLAAEYRLRQQRRVGLVTVDTYRIAAVEQLRTYADIIDLPMEVAATPRDMRAAIDRLSGQELILIDTAGRSPRDEDQDPGTEIPAGGVPCGRGALGAEQRLRRYLSGEDSGAVCLGRSHRAVAHQIGRSRRVGRTAVAAASLAAAAQLPHARPKCSRRHRSGRRQDVGTDHGGHGACLTRPVAIWRPVCFARSDHPAHEATKDKHVGPGNGVEEAGVAIGAGADAGWESASATVGRLRRGSRRGRHHAVRESGGGPVRTGLPGGSGGRRRAPRGRGRPVRADALHRDHRRVGGAPRHSRSAAAGTGRHPSGRGM